MDLKQRRLELHLTLEEIGKEVGVGKSTVRKWEAGEIKNMGRDKIVKLSQALHINPLEIIDPNHELFNQAEDTIKSSISERDEIPRGADEAISISTDSMEPKIHDGSIQFIHYQPALDFDGEIMLVDIDGQGVTCREVHCEKNKDRLVALNPKYDDIIVPADKVHIIGKVIF